MKTKHLLITAVLLFTIFGSGIFAQNQSNDRSIRISAEKREISDLDSGAFIISNEILNIKANETAIVVCDMVDRHWCKSISERIAEMAPSINNVLAIARNKGMLIVHTPYGCMDFYKNHPARKVAEKYRKYKTKVLSDLEKLTSEKEGTWPIDREHNGCDCEIPCSQGKPWVRQIDLIGIENQDVISESGFEIAGLFNEYGIKNVILLGINSDDNLINGSVGIRSMVRLGLKTFLMRDLMDIMFRPNQSTMMSHYTGNNLVIEYVERYLCPTIVSCDLTGLKQFRFKNDKRPIVAFITAEDEYRTNQRFPEFAHELLLTKNLNCEFAIGKPIAEGEGRHNIENLQVLEDASLMVLCVRRRALEAEKLQLIKDYVNSGKPVLGIRTASHAFDAKGVVPRTGGGIVSSNEKVSDVLSQWPEFDKEVLGGNYQGHYGHLKEKTVVSVVPGMENHPMLKGINPKGFGSPGWLYLNRPLRSENIQVLLLGTIPEQPVEPILWINNHEKGKVIYTSLGHWDDWELVDYRKLMLNAVDFLLGINKN